MNILVFFKHQISRTSFLLGFSLLFIGCNNQKNWYQFTSEENNFKIKFPGKPVIHDPSFHGSGQMTIKTDAYDYQEGEVYYKSLSNSYSENLINNAGQVDSVFNALTNKILSDNKGSILNKLNIKIKDHPGMELKIKLKNKDILETVRVFIMDNNRVQINIASMYDSKSAKYNPEIEKNAKYFLDSFEFVGEY